ncbi:MAG: hypothetical protein ABI273_12605 [Lacunisphaera sp.]
MNSDPLDDLLRTYAKHPVPTPPELTTAVWSMIANRRKRPFWSGLLPVLSLSEVFREPRLAFPALALALLVGILPATITSSTAAAKLARESLHFEVFAAHSPGTPSALLDFGGGERISRSSP